MTPDSRVLFHHSARRRVIDAFAGPGGWSEGLRMLGYSELGIEWDEAACATARAAGHERLLADVAELDPVDFAPCWGFIASAPCQAWSGAGKGGGRRDVEHVIACAMEVAAGNDTRAEHAAKCEDPRSMLVVEPLRWIIALRPEWVALEQVPAVLELWSLFAQILGSLGYSAWAGVLNAADYGVPQTRERAMLIATRSGVANPPEATHREGGAPASLFGPALSRWTTIEDVCPDRRGWELESIRGAGMVERHGDRPRRRSDEPSFAVLAWKDSRMRWRRGDETEVFTVADSLLFQSFRADYPVTGSATRAQVQVGNAVPPLLAHAVLAELAGEALEEAA